MSLAGHRIEKGTVWRNNDTGRTATVVEVDRYTWGKVRLEHETGRVTTKQIHYFLYDYELIQKTEAERLKDEAFEPLKEEASKRRLHFWYGGDTYRDEKLVDWRIQLEEWPAIFFVYPEDGGYIIAARHYEGKAMDWSGRGGVRVESLASVIRYLDRFEQEIQPWR